MTLKQKNTILYCPLDWGLGHASRGVFLIHKFLEKGFRVIIAADGEPLALLREEFPELNWIRFPSYRIRYSRSIPLMLKLLLSLPGMLVGIAREHKVLKRLLKEHPIDIVVSDNRYGLWDKQKFTILITHQLSIRLPGWLSWFEAPLYRLNRKQVQRFSQVWIPDETGENSLSGELSQKYPLPENAKFIGICSRFMYHNTQVPEVSVEQYDLLAILSGPEPQRTVLEEKICAQLKNSEWRCLIVRGLPSQTIENTRKGKLTLSTHLPTNTLEALIKSSKIIISRSGYSTIMDFVALKKTALLIPTPGQTEQEYLGRRMEKKMNFLCLNQNNLNLQKSISEFTPRKITFTADYQLLESAIKELQ